MPEDIECILEYVVECSKGYDNHMKWNEEAKLKADMMKHVDRWRLVSTLLPTGCAACSAPCLRTTARPSSAGARASQAQRFLDTVQTCALPIAVGVGLCIASPIPTMVMGGTAEAASLSVRNGLPCLKSQRTPPAV